MKLILALAGFAVICTTQVPANAAETGQWIRAEETYASPIEAKPRLRVRCRDGRRALNRPGACKGHGGKRK